MEFMGLNVSNQMHLYGKKVMKWCASYQHDTWIYCPQWHSGRFLFALRCVLHLFIFHFIKIYTHPVYVICIIDCRCKRQALCITHMHVGLRQSEPPPRSFDTSASESDGYTCALDSWHSCLADKIWASLCMNLTVLLETDRGGRAALGSAGERYLAFTLWRASVFKWSALSNHGWFAFTAYISALQVIGSDARWIIRIQGPRSVRPVNRRAGKGRGWGMWDGEGKGQSRDSAVSSVISYLERQTPGTPPPNPLQ